jgi:hypothetical protein
MDCEAVYGWIMAKRGFQAAKQIFARPILTRDEVPQPRYRRTELTAALESL